MRKAFLALLTILLAVILITMPAETKAAESGIMPRSMQTTSCSLSISGATAKYGGVVSAAGCSKLSVTLSLQKYKDRKWRTVKTNSMSTTNASLTFTKSKLITAGKFRAKATVKAEKGALTETFTYYSAVKTKG